LFSFAPRSSFDIFPVDKSKKDPGIPNSWPFKEQLLNEIEERKQRMAQEKEDKKKATQAKRQKAKEAKKANDAPAA
jgi:GNL3L/Grn1 putative GTPase